MKYPVIYRNLAKELAINGISKKDLAKIIGRAPSAVSNKMAGKTDFKCDEMELASKYFGKSMDYLFSTETEKIIDFTIVRK